VTGRLRVGLSQAWLWRALFRWKLARVRMGMWRVVVEATPNVPMRGRETAAVVTGVWVWANDAEEAEALASLAIESEGFSVLTADASPAPPEAAPLREAGAIARTALSFYDSPPTRGPDARLKRKAP
jgi:hypothetical protein